jgi:hypothetical protein
MRFTGRGSIVRWRVGGNQIIGDQNENPRLQIWRPVSPGASTYEIAHELPLLAPNGGTFSGTQVVPNNVHEHSLSIAPRVEPGDIFGMFLSRRSGQQSRLDIFFEGSSSREVQYYRYTGTLTEFSGDGDTNTSKPLVALQIVCDGMWKCIAFCQ